MHVCLDIWFYLWVYISPYVYISMYIRIYVCTDRCTAICTYISMCVVIGPYRYRAIWGESTLVWGFFPGKGRDELGWTMTPSPSLLYWGWWWGLLPPPQHSPMLVGLWRARGGSGMWGGRGELGVMLQSWRGSPAGQGSGGAGLWPCQGELGELWGLGVVLCFILILSPRQPPFSVMLSSP